MQQTGLPPLTGEVAKPKVLTEGFTPLRKEKYEMKRFLSLLLAAVLLLALAACGRGGGCAVVHMAGRAREKKHYSAQKRKIAFPPKQN